MNYQQIVQVVSQAATDKLAHNPVAFDVSQRLPFADAFVVTSGDNPRQVAAIADEVSERLRESGVNLVRSEGREEMRWIVLDFGAVIVHVFNDDDREYYDLERLWRDCPRIDVALPDDSTVNSFAEA